MLDILASTVWVLLNYTTIERVLQQYKGNPVKNSDSAIYNELVPELCIKSNQHAHTLWWHLYKLQQKVIFFYVFLFGR